MQGSRYFEFYKGPIFGQLILADEINRASPKTQSALLEAMQEESVTVFGAQYHLEPPFMVLATQNPIEMEGTYPLPEAQIDRFFFKLKINYPDQNELRQILDKTTEDYQYELKRVIRSGFDSQDEIPGQKGADRLPRKGLRHPAGIGQPSRQCACP